MIKNQYACVHCGVKVVKNGRNSDGSQRYLCRGCGATRPLSEKRPQPGKYVFIGRHGTEYTVASIVTAMGGRISYDTALRRLKIAIDDPSREDELLELRSRSYGKNSLGIPGERLTEKQKKTMSEFRAVHDNKMTLNELLEKHD